MIVKNKTDFLTSAKYFKAWQQCKMVTTSTRLQRRFPLYIFTSIPSILNCTNSHPNFVKFSLALLSIHVGVVSEDHTHARARILCLVVLRVVLVIAFTFPPWNFGKYRDLWLVLLHSTNTDWVVGTLKPYLLYSSLFELFALTGSETLKYLPQLLAPEPPGETFTA